MQLAFGHGTALEIAKTTGSTKAQPHILALLGTVTWHILCSRADGTLAGRTVLSSLATLTISAIGRLALPSVSGRHTHRRGYGDCRCKLHTSLGKRYSLKENKTSLSYLHHSSLKIKSQVCKLGRCALHARWKSRFWRRWPH